MHSDWQLTLSTFPFQRGFYLEGVAMVLADGDVIRYRGIDQMRRWGRVAIHQVMEQQTIFIAEADITINLGSRISVWTAANTTSVLTARDPLFG